MPRIYTTRGIGVPDGVLVSMGDGTSEWYERIGTTNDYTTPDGEFSTLVLAGSGVHWMEPRDLPETANARRINTLPGGCPSSRHSGGVNVLFADGHVEFLPNNIDQRTFQALCTPNGGEPSRVTPRPATQVVSAVV